MIISAPFSENSSSLIYVRVKYERSAMNFNGSLQIHLSFPAQSRSILYVRPIASVELPEAAIDRPP